MSSYFTNEAALDFPGVHSLLDLTRHCIEVRTEEGAELQLVIERPRVTSTAGLAASVEASLAERRRSLRGFELLSITEREYPDVSGMEIRVTYIDKERGPLFVHEFRCLIERTELVYQCSCRMPFASACDTWLMTTLQTLRRR